MIPYHIPVMLNECIEALNINPEGIYVDLTFGGGGHTKAILEKLTTGKLYAFDQDQDAVQNADAINSENLVFVAANFRYLKRYLRLHRINKVDGILGDLGISSHQIDTPERGFSTRFEGDLDMRMNKNDSLTAKELLNTYSEADLHKILGKYGEVRNARTLARAIVTQRINEPFTTISEFKKLLTKHAPRHKEFRYFAQVFQAIRIAINDEMKALEEVLEQSAEMLKKDGRLVVLTYHSLEDRLVKNFINKGKFEGEVDKDFFGNDLKPLQALNRKPRTASEEELKINNRSRSAKLRIAKKL
jgi:16S rRNA (cytosine1402-N4)-methyltransferase